MGHMEHSFSVAEARAMLAEARPVIADIVAARRQLAECMRAFQAGDRRVLPDMKGLEARISERLDWFASRGVQVKGYAPLLLDWPQRRGDRVVLLCWLENEPELAWYHDADLGFLGRRPLSDLDDEA
jgi:hypothetical protein